MADAPDDSINEIEDDAKDVDRSYDWSRKKPIRDKLLDLYNEIQEGFQKQVDRSNKARDYWDLYNCKLGAKQGYQGNAEIFVPIVYEAVTARKTRFANQIFPASGRYVECTTSDETLPQALMALGEHYVRKAGLRNLLPALCMNGDIEGQYTIYVGWDEHSRFVTRKKKKLDPEGGDHFYDLEEDVEIKRARPYVEIVQDADFLVLPGTVDKLQEALDAGGSVTILRRWTKAKIKSLGKDGIISKAEAKELCEMMSKPEPNPAHPVDQAKQNVDAAGIKADGRGKFMLVYETWSMVELDDGLRLCRTYFGGPDRVMCCVRNPFWSDRLPIISCPAQKVAGSFKGQSMLSNGVDTLQYYANDMMNEAADSATFSMMPIIMTDPDKNPRMGSMILSLAAVWQTSPQDTQFAQFPPIWKDGFTIISQAKQEIFQALSVSPAIIPHGTNKKQSQADVANEQQVDLLTTAEAVTNLEQGILTPMLLLFMEYDHQFRDDKIQIQQYGDLGRRAAMETVEPMQMDHRYEFRWFGVEAARSQQQVQQQIAGMNILKGIPPQLYQGYELNLAPAIVQMVENTFGPRLGPLVFKKLEPPVPPQEEVELAEQGIEMPVSPLSDHQAVMKLLMASIQKTGDPSGAARQQMLKHQAMAMQKAQAQQQKGMPGSPGGGGQPGAAGTPREGSMPGPQRGQQQPPGAIHPDKMPLAMPRRMG